MVLHKSNFSQSLLHIGLIHIWLSRTAVMLSAPTSDYARCQCCNASFQRLPGHLSQNEFCGAYYKSMPLDIGNGGVTDDMHVPGVAYFNQAGAIVDTQKLTRIYGRVFLLTNQFLTMTMMPLLCLTGTTNFLATRNLMTIARMRTFVFTHSTV